MFLNNDMATFLSTYHASLTRTYAGVGAHQSDPNSYYIVVDPDTIMDNGEVSLGVLAVKISMVTINLHAKTTMSVLSTPLNHIKTALAVRQRQITEHWLQGCILQSEDKYDFRNDPQGREQGIPDIVLTYRVAWRRLPE